VTGRGLLGVSLLLLIVGISITPALFAQTTDLTLDLVGARLTILRNDAGAGTDEVIQAYEVAQTRLQDAASFDRDAEKYATALSSAAGLEAEIQARIDKFDRNQIVSVEVADLSGEELDSRLVLIRSELRDSKAALDTYERRLAGREMQAELLRVRLNEISQRLGETDEVGLSIDPDASPGMTEALQWGAAAEQIALMAERRAKQAQFGSQPVRYSVLQAERAEISLRVERLVGQLRVLEQGVRRNLSDDAESVDLGIDDDDPLYAVANMLAMENSRLQLKRLELEELVIAVSAQEAAVVRSTRDLGQKFTTARRVVGSAAASDALGAILLAYWEDIDSYRLADSTTQLSQQLGDTVISHMDHEEAFSETANVSGYVTGRIRDAGLDPAAVAEPGREVLVKLASTKRELLRRIIAMESDYIFVLSELEAEHTSLMVAIDEYEEYLSVLILWKPSRQRLWRMDLRALDDEFSGVMGSLRELRPVVTPLFLVTLLFAGILYLLRRSMLDVQLTQNARILRSTSDSIGSTFVALLLTGLRALPATLLIFAIGILFSRDSTSPMVELPNAIKSVAITLFVLLFTRTLCGENEVARAHFGWRPNLCKQWVEDASWLVRWWLPITAFAAAVFILADDTAAVGRLALLLAIAVFLGRLVSNIRRGMLISEWRWSIVTTNRLRLMIGAIFMLLAAGVFWGLRYSVGIMTRSLLTTICIGIGLLLAQSLLSRWLGVVHRRLRIAELRRTGTEQAAGEATTFEENQAELRELSEETTQLLHLMTLVVTVVTLSYIWAPLLPAFDFLSEVTLWTSATVAGGESVIKPITLETLVVVILLICVTVAAALKLPGLVELVLRARTNMTAGARYTTSTLMVYVIVGVGVISALSALGLQWSKIQWLIAALGVGIGFGLQEIVADFISGLIILFERPIRIGDIVTVGNNVGEVSKIRIRATTIRDWDGRDLLVPNREFTAGQLLNWSLSDTHMRIVISVGIAYGSDVEQALKTLDEIAADHSAVLKEPKPRVIFEDFGDNALELSARCFLGQYTGWQGVATELRREIYRRFTEAGIVIAFPQRDVHIDSERPIRIVVEPPPGNA